MMRLGRGVAASALLTAATLVGAASAAEAPVPIDYAAQFAKNFPAVAGEHRIVDWQLYAALVSGDLLSYAARVDPAVAKQREQARGKGYQMQELAAGVKQDKRLRAAFDEQRRRIGSMVLFANDDDGARDACQRPLVYVEKEFRLVLGGCSAGADPLATATVAPSCPPMLEPGFQITAGHSPRFKCWEGAYSKTCGWRLPDMPDGLKRVVENDYPTSIKLRWRWRGLGGVTRVRYINSNGNRVADHDSVALTIPLELGLEFVDGKGHILWTAAGGRVGGSAPLARSQPQD